MAGRRHAAAAVLSLSRTLLWGRPWQRFSFLAMRLRIRVLSSRCKKALPKTSLQKMEGGEAPKGATPQAAPAQTSLRSLRKPSAVRRAPRGNGRYHPSALRARSPFGAPPRARLGELTPPLSSSRASWVRRHRVSPASSPIPVQRAPRRPVIITGRAVSGAARERVYGPPAGTAPVPLPKVPSRKVPP
jgi:hypothetical protein